MATSISPISKPLMRRSISPLISNTSQNSSFRASASQLDSSPRRLSASRSSRSLASSRSLMITAGASVRPILRAARTRPQPATTRLSASITSGSTKPISSRLSANFWICLGGCLRVSRPSGFRASRLTSIGLRSRDTAKPFPRNAGCRFIAWLPQTGRARITSGHVNPPPLCKKMQAAVCSRSEGGDRRDRVAESNQGRRPFGHSSVKPRRWTFAASCKTRQNSLLYPDSMRTREKCLAFGGGSDSDGRMIRGGFLIDEDRKALIALARDGLAAGRVTRRAQRPGAAG